MAISYKEPEPPAPEDDDEGAPIEPISTKRLRWATQRHAGNKGKKKRNSIIGRIGHKGSMSSEKKRFSNGGDSVGGVQGPPESTEGQEEEAVDDQEGQGPRKVYFNLPLPPEAVDEDGHPAKQFRRNKIRTAKYTAISFIPKNLYFQFQNIANVYFLFLIILAVSMPTMFRKICADTI
jgi:phospholipid-translocating ATPase